MPPSRPILCPGPQVSSCWRAGRAAYRLGLLEEAAADFDRGTDVVEPASDLGATLESEYCQVAVLIPRRATDVPERLQRAVAALEGGHRGPGGKTLLATASMSHGLWGSPRELGTELAEQALEGDELVADAVAGGNGLFSVTATLTWAEQFDRAFAVIDECAEAAARQGEVMCWVTCNFCRALPNLLSGRLREAVADSEIGIAAEARGWEQFLPAAYAWRASAQIELGDLTGAERGLAELSADQWQSHPTWPLIEAARGRLFLERGDLGRALECFERWGHSWPVPNPAAYADWRSHAALALVLAGRVREGRGTR